MRRTADDPFLTSQARTSLDELPAQVVAPPEGRLRWFADAGAAADLQRG